VADVGRGVRGSAVDVDGGLALVVGVDGVLVGGDVRIASGLTTNLTSSPGSQFSTARVTPLSSSMKSAGEIVSGETVSSASAAGAEGASVSSSTTVTVAGSEVVSVSWSAPQTLYSPGSRAASLLIVPLTLPLSSAVTVATPNGDSAVPPMRSTAPPGVKPSPSTVIPSF